MSRRTDKSPTRILHIRILFAPPLMVAFFYILLLLRGTVDAVDLHRESTRPSCGEERFRISAAWNPVWRTPHVNWRLRHAITPEVVAYVLLDRLCRGDISITASLVALPALGKPSPIKRAGQLRVEPKCGTIIVDSRGYLARLQVYQTTQVIRRGAAGIRLKRLVAILQRSLQRAANSSRPAAPLPHALQVGSRRIASS